MSCVIVTLADCQFAYIITGGICLFLLIFLKTFYKTLFISLAALGSLLCHARSLLIAHGFFSCGVGAQ